MLAGSVSTSDNNTKCPTALVAAHGAGKPPFPAAWTRLGPPRVQSSAAVLALPFAASLSFKKDHKTADTSDRCNAPLLLPSPKGLLLAASPSFGGSDNGDCANAGNESFSGDMVHVLPVPDGGALDDWTHPFLWSITAPLPCDEAPLSPFDVHGRRSPLPAPFADDTDRMVVLAGNKLFVAPHAFGEDEVGGDDGQLQKKSDSFEEGTRKGGEGPSFTPVSATKRPPETVALTFAALKAANDHYWRAVPRRRFGGGSNSTSLASAPRSASDRSPSSPAGGDVLLRRLRAARGKCVSTQSSLRPPAVVLGLGGLYMCGCDGSDIDAAGSCSSSGGPPPPLPIDAAASKSPTKEFSQQSLSLVMQFPPSFIPPMPQLAADQFPRQATADGCPDHATIPAIYM